LLNLYQGSKSSKVAQLMEHTLVLQIYG